MQIYSGVYVDDKKGLMKHFQVNMYDIHKHYDENIKRSSFNFLISIFLNLYNDFTIL